MFKKIVWVGICLLVVMALVLASCGPAETEEEEGQTITGDVTQPGEEEEEEAVVEDEGPEMVVDALGRLVEKPQYGGSTKDLKWSWMRWVDWLRNLNTADP